MRACRLEARRDHVQAILRAIRDLNETMQRHTDATCRHLGMSRSEVRALNLVARRGTATPTELGTQLGVTSGGVTGILDRLEASGHLRRTDDQRDRRKVKVEVTESARRVAHRTLDDLNQALRQILTGRSADDLELLLELLNQIEERIAQHTESMDRRPAVSARSEAAGATGPEASHAGRVAAGGRRG